MKNKAILTIVLVLIAASVVFPQTTSFTYQGSLQSGGSPANGNYDLEFKLFDLASGGTQQGSTVQRLNVPVTNGAFAVSLDFGAGTLSGADRFLDIAVRTAGGGSFTTLTPRQKVNSSPYSVKSLNAATADVATNATQLGGVAANQYVLTSDPRMTDARNPLPNSANYIQNQNVGPQASSNFSISGTGSANIFNATTQFNVGGNRILSNSGTGNLFVGRSAGSLGANNTFVGSVAGAQSTAFSGSNSFFGAGAGSQNGDGGNNAFFGADAGGNNSGPIANANTFIGALSGSGNTTGRLNTLLGFSSNMPFGGGLINATAIGGRAFVTQDNSLVLGSINGVNGATDDTNVGIGTTAPSQRLHVVGNGLFTGNLTVSGTLNATLPTGSGNYIQNATSQQAGSNFNISGNGTAGGTLTGNVVHARTQFDVDGIDGDVARILYGNISSNNLFVGIGAGVSNTTGEQNTFVGRGTGPGNLTGNNNTFLGAAAGNGNLGSNNTAVGRFAGLSNTTGSNNTLIGANSNVSSPTLSYASAIGADAVVGTNNTIVIGRNGGQETVLIPGSLNVNGTFSGNGSGLSNVTASTTANLALIAMLRWDMLGPKSFPAGSGPDAVAFDGVNIWVTNRVSPGTVTKLRPTDGAILGTFFAGAGNPQGIAFDGANIWIPNNSGSTVAKLRASDGVNLGNFNVGVSPVGIAFDGVNVWVANSTSGSVTKLRASDGADQGTFPTGPNPSTVAFDGANVWITNSGTSTVTKLRASDGANQGNFTVGNFPRSIAFDGANMWVGDSSANVTKLRASDGFNLGTFSYGGLPLGIAFDGTNIWVVRGGTPGGVTKVRPSDGATLGSFPVGNAPQKVAFDGANIWVANFNTNNVTKIQAIP